MVAGGGRRRRARRRCSVLWAVLGQWLCAVAVCGSVIMALMAPTGDPHLVSTARGEINYRCLFPWT